MLAPLSERQGVQGAEDAASMDVGVRGAARPLVKRRGAIMSLSRSALAGLLLLGTARHTSSQDALDPQWTIALKSGPLDVRALRAADESRAARDIPAADGGRYALVKFGGPITADQHRALAASVERVYAYLPHYTYLIRKRTDGPATAAAEATGALWSGLYEPAYKLAPSMKAVTANETEAAVADTGRRAVLALVYPDADLARVVATLRARGLEVAGSRPSAFFSRVRLLLTPAQIVATREALAAIPEVFWLEAEPRRVLFNDTSVWVGQSGLNGGQTTPIFDRGILGQGQIVGVLDTGIDADMCYFRDPARGLPPRNECNGGTTVDLNQRKVVAVDFLWSQECAGGITGAEWDTNDHGSHVAGTVAGDNFANPLGRDPGDGMAPGAKLVMQDCGFRTDDCADCPGIGCPVVDLNPIFQQAYTHGARIHTNSWGDRENFTPGNIYSAGSQDADEFMWNHKDFLLFFSAGNSGPLPGTVHSPSTGKNVVSVGATLRAASAGRMASFSSCGPTDDGRIKPDITMPGSGIVSANADNNITSNNCGTQALSGTSMASPGAAGLAALVRQYFTAGFYPSGREITADRLVPSAALLKAALLNSARSMEATTLAIPSSCQGWGRVLLEEVLFFEGERRKLWVRDDAAGFPLGSVGEMRDVRFRVAAGEPLKVTLTWTDFPSTPAASPHLNNDLDLVVTGPGGTFRGNVFSGGQSMAGGSSDRRNTVEQVLLAAPAAGEYVVSVRSVNVPNGPQPFALVVTGDAAACGASCGGGTTVFTDDFETEKGWQRNPAGTDTATTGLWERGDPQATTSNGPKQLGNTTSGVNALVTGRLAGANASANDVDGGVTSIRSPQIALPANATLTLGFRYYLAHHDTSSTADFLRVRVVGANTATVFEKRGAAADVDAAWASATVSLTPFAGQTIQIVVEAADVATASLLEAAVDDLRIDRQ
jgi:subtilisin family serine protease